MLKKLLYRITALYLAFCFSFISFGNMHTLAVCGDADGDGIVTAADGKLVFDYVSGKDVELGYTGKNEADVDGDGVITVGDAAQILRYVNGTEAVLPTNAFLRLTVLSMPHKTSYLPGESFDMSGFRLGALYTGGQCRILTNYTYSGYTDSVGAKIITVEGKGKKTSFVIRVDEPVPTALEITNYPTVRQYSVGKRLDISGLSLAAVYEDGSKIPINAYSVSGYDSEPGIHTVKLMYMGVSAEYTVGCGYATVVNCGGTKINVRSGGGTSSPVVGTFNEGASIVVIDPTGENGWCYCWGKGSDGDYISGWCFKDYLIITV